MNKEFLEDYSLFRKFRCDVPSTLLRLPKTPINMHCSECASTQTFTMTNEYYEDYEFTDSCGDKKVRLWYLCQSCRSFSRQFNVYMSPELDYFYKYGQYPEWEIKMDKNLEKTLGANALTYKKGLACESQGYGIGAFAYYRRIVEVIIDELLESITELIDDANKEKYSVALEKTKSTRVTQEKIDLVKDLLPNTLRPSGINPLGVLHSELSEGLHSKPDEECLESATHVKVALVYLVNQIIRSKEESKEFTASMKSLLDKKAGI